MHVLIAPDRFGRTLTAAESARAIVRGWGRRVPHDTFTSAPMADGGPGFVDVLHEALGGELAVVPVTGPWGDPTPVALLEHAGSVYVEASQACGTHLVGPADHDGHDVGRGVGRGVERASTVGVGEALLAAIDAAPARIVVGLGTSATNDGGAGMLDALGADADVPLDRGPAAMRDVTRVDLQAARTKLDGIELVVATDVETTLLGMFGTTRSFGTAIGLDESAIQRVDTTLDGFVDATCGATPAERRVADAAGAGAAGGLGFALMVLGARVRSGVDLVARSVGLLERARECDLVVTGEAEFGFSSRAGSVVYEVAAIAAEAVRPCIVLAGTVQVGAREMRALGVESAYSVEEYVGTGTTPSGPAGRLEALAERIARTWSH